MERYLFIKDTLFDRNVICDCHMLTALEEATEWLTPLRQLINLAVHGALSRIGSKAAGLIRMPHQYDLQFFEDRFFISNFLENSLVICNQESVIMADVRVTT